MKQVFLGLILSHAFLLSQSFAYSIDASGQIGVDGSKERDYSTSRGASSRNGSSGNNATRSSKGLDGGVIEITLQEVSTGHASSMIQVTGTKKLDGQRRQQINETLSFGNGEKLSLNVNGGRGGHGGHGGDGEGGCNGQDGRDARKNSVRATNGTDGCRGGDGGNGTKGSNGGNGGRVIVNVPLDSVHILRSIDINVSEGRGGDSGKNGRAGSGGRGGDGGRGDRWNEKVGTKPKTVYYTDYKSERDCNLVKQGDGSYKNICNNIQVPFQNSKIVQEDVYEWKTAPGGRDGRNAADGSSGSGNITAGRRGQRGSYIFNVIYPNGEKKAFKKPFELKINSYNIVESESTRNGIFEPGETIYLENIVVSNVGEAPSPSQNAQVIMNVRSPSLQIESGSLIIPMLKGGERTRLPNRIAIKIPRDSRIGRLNGVEILHEIIPSAYVDRTRMNLREFSLKKAIHAKYPVVITFFDVPKVMAPGEKLPLMIKVRNISNRDLGEQRELSYQVRTSGGSTTPSHIRYSRQEDGEEQSLTSAIESLKANQSLVLETYVSLSDQTPVYTNFAVETSLFVEKLGDQRESLVQRQSLEIKVVQKYNYRPDSDLLLVINSKTTRDEYNAWMEFGAKSGIKIDIWDMSYYGSFSLQKSLEDGATLISNYENKTIILVNNDSAESEEAIRSLRASSFLTATQRYNINFLFMGGSEIDNNNLIHSYLRTSLRDEESLETEMNTGFLSKIFSSFTARKDDSIQSFNRSLLQTNPGERFIIEANSNDTLIARPALGVNGGHAYALSLNRNEIHSPQFILSEEMFRAVILPLSLESKLNLLGKSSDKAVRDTVLFDIIYDIMLADIGEDTEFETRAESMTNYKDFIEYIKRKGSVNGYEYVIAAMLEYAPFLESTKLKEMLNKDLESFSSSKIQELRNDISQTAKNRHELLPGINAKKNMENMLTLPAIHRLKSTEYMQNENVNMEIK